MHNRTLARVALVYGRQGLCLQQYISIRVVDHSQRTPVTVLTLCRLFLLLPTKLKPISAIAGVAVYTDTYYIITHQRSHALGKITASEQLIRGVYDPEYVRARGRRLTAYKCTELVLKQIL
jgi:hypothetical protein